MHLILRYTNGHRADALLLTMTPDTMRVVLHRRNDTVEYRRISDRWAGDDGSRVSIEAMLAAAAVRPAGYRGLTLSAGG
jgi:hypothetical protein